MRANPDLEAVAARREDGDQTCAYPDCDRDADWFVEVHDTTTRYWLTACDPCAQTHRLYPTEVLDNEVDWP